MTDEPTSLEVRIVRSSAWVALSWGGRNLFSFLSMLVLARLLEPRAFGVIAVATTVVMVLETIQESGVGAALIYRRGDIEGAAASTAFAFAAASGLMLAAVLVAGAPLLAAAFGVPAATPVLRVMALLIVIRGFTVGPGAMLERELDFRSRAKAELTAGATQLGVAVGLAVAGLGVWALVAGYLAAASVSSVVMWNLVSWRPSLRQVDRGVLREMVRYGRFVSAGNLLGLVNQTIQTGAVGRLLGAGPLGFYTVTYRIADFPTAVVGYVVGRVMFPAYAEVQDDVAAFRRAFVQNLERVALLGLPVAVGLLIAAEPITRVLLGPAWLPIVTPMRILAVFTIVRNFTAPCGSVFQAAGKPQLVPIWALPQTIALLPLLIVLVPRFGVSGAALGVLLAYTISGLPALAVAMRLLELRLGALARALAPAFACSALLGIVLLALLPVAKHLAPGLELTLLAGTGVGVYVVSAGLLARATISPIWWGLHGSRT